MIGRDGGPEGLTIMVDYYTEDGTANAGNDYIPVEGTLIFYPEDKIQVNNFMSILFVEMELPNLIKLNKKLILLKAAKHLLRLVFLQE